MSTVVVDPADALKTPVTVLGLGAMGRALAGAFLRAGHPTTVWNRSPGRDGELVAAGARTAASPADAVRAGELIVVCVVDYDGVQAILDQAADALPGGGRVLVNLTSDSPERAREAADWAAKRDIAYLDGAIMVPVPVIGRPEALVFYSGAGEVFERYEGVLGALGGRSAYVGADAGKAAVYDFALLDYFYGSMAGLVHAFALAAADGVSATELAPYLGTITGIMPGIAAGSARDIDAGEYPGDGANLAMMAAAVDHLVEASERRGLDAGTLRSIQAVAARAIAEGRGGESWATTVESLREGRPQTGS
ncbi:NAD(P)-dependent oxidoreductase [Streptomyces sp. NPDC091292]|uniref:NAD(P)-dependent oxidoreductase n=1 Tax=Streptomyces sp. NPDC091292 TaxID=3365991 RepID=UPI0038307A9C